MSIINILFVNYVFHIKLYNLKLKSTYFKILGKINESSSYTEYFAKTLPKGSNLKRVENA